MRRLILLCLILLAGCAKTPVDSFRQFEDDYWSAWARAFPSAATSVGFHDYDSQLEDYSPGAIDARARSLDAFAERLQKLQTAGIAKEDEIDADILLSAIRSELQDLRELQTWKKNPMGYVGTPGGAIDGLMKRNFAPAKDRLRSVIGRLKGVAPMLDAMKANVQNPPKEFTDLAIRMGEGSIGFFKETVAGWAKEAAGGDQQLLAEFNTANNAAAAAMESAAKWLKADLLPRSTGKYAIGAEAFSKKLLYDEMNDIPLDRVLAIGEANLQKDYQAFLETSKKIQAGRPPAAVMAKLSDDHPSAVDLIPATRRTLTGIQKFLVDKKIIELPSMQLPNVEETPPYARSGSFASMDTPGAYESKATEAFYYVTPPEKNWDAKHTEEHLRLYNKPVMDIITIHEVFPGHYAQFLYAKQFPTKTRKLYFCGTNAEGWAHYAEQMMIEEGFGGSDPKLRLAQLSEALLRDCRYIAGIKLHTQGWTVEQAAKLFVEKGFQEPANAYEEARRGAYNPTYLYYTLGKLQIYKLREDYRKAKGQDFSLARFHSDFVRQGAIPIKLIRRILLGSDGDLL